MNQPIPMKTPGKINRSEVVETLVVEGHIMFTEVKSVDEITDEQLISASHNVIKELAHQKAKLLNDLREYQDLLNQFYRECQHNNIVVTRDPSNKIKLQRLG